MVMFVAAFCAQAAIETVNGVAWIYEIDNGEARIEGVQDAVANLVIPERLGGVSVTEIGSNVFEENEIITSVTFSSSIKIVEHHAFEECVNLKSLSLNEGLLHLGHDAFRNLYSLKSVTIPSSVRKIAEGNFTRSGEEGGGMTYIQIAGGNNAYFSVDNGILYDVKNKTVLAACANISKAILPSDCVRIGEVAFLGCEKLSSVTFSKTLQEIGDEAFAGTGLVSVDLSETVLVEASEQAFCYCFSLQKVVFPASLKKVDSHLFGGDNALKQVVFMGDAPIIDNSAEEDTEVEYFPAGDIYVTGRYNNGDDPYVKRLTSVVTYVYSGTEGWGVVPGQWQGCPVKYWQSDKVDTVNISVAVADGCEAMGKVTGGKTAKAGTKLTLKATANKGYVFSHWEGPLGDVADPRLPSVTYTVGNEDAQFTAHFISFADDVAAISFEMADEYVTGAATDPVAVDVYGCTSLPKVTVKGLPSGLKFTAKDVYKKGSKTEIEYPANTIYGTPTKSGVNTVVATVMTAGKKTATCSQTIIVRKPNEKVVVPLAVSEGGEVKGGGVYTVGKKVTLKATAKKGYVFAGWYEDENFTKPCDSTVTDYRNPSYAYTMGEADKMFYARFEPAANDTKLDLTVDGSAVPETFTVSEYAQLALDVESLSLPKISVKGLPAGMKFTAKPIFKKGSKTEIEVPANTIYGTPTKPDRRMVSVSISNTSIKKAIVKEFTIEVPNLTAANGYFVDELINGVGEKYSLSVGISNIDDFLPDLRLNSSTAKLTVSGLPAGLKYDAKIGKITGIATKAGTYTVTLTITDGKAKYVSTITVEVEALPDWVVGTFSGGVKTYGRGWDDACGFEVKVTANGRVFAKLIEANPAWGSVSLKTYGLRRNSENEYMFVIRDGDYENGGDGSVGEVCIYRSDNGLGCIYVEEIGIDEDGDQFEAFWNGCQDIYS